MSGKSTRAGLDGDGAKPRGPQSQNLTLSLHARNIEFMAEFETKVRRLRGSTAKRSTIVRSLLRSLETHADRVIELLPPGTRAEETEALMTALLTSAISRGLPKRRNLAFGRDGASADGASSDGASEDGASSDGVG